MVELEVASVELLLMVLDTLGTDSGPQSNELLVDVFIADPLIAAPFSGRVGTDTVLVLARRDIRCNSLANSKPSLELDTFEVKLGRCCIVL